MTHLVTVCAWCQKERGESPQEGQSHGICPRHNAELAAEAGLRERYVVLPARSDLAYSRSYDLGRALADAEEWDRQRSNVRTWGRAVIYDAWEERVLDAEQLREWARHFDSKDASAS